VESKIKFPQWKKSGERSFFTIFQRGVYPGGKTLQIFKSIFPLLGEEVTY